MDRKKFMRAFFRKSNVSKMVNQFDQLVKSDIVDATNRGKLLLGINEDQIFAHPSFVYAMPFILNKKMRSTLIHTEDRVRFDIAHFNALYFDEHTLYYYNTVIDHKISGSFNDKTVELPYKNIKAIETSLQFTKIDGVSHNIYQLVLKLDGLEDLVIPLRVMIIDEKTPTTKYLINKDLLDIVTNLKQFLRSKMI